MGILEKTNEAKLRKRFEPPVQKSWIRSWMHLLTEENCWNMVRVRFFLYKINWLIYCFTSNVNSEVMSGLLESAEERYFFTNKVPDARVDFIFETPANFALLIIKTKKNGSRALTVIFYYQMLMKKLDLNNGSTSNDNWSVQLSCLTRETLSSGFRPGTPQTRLYMYSQRLEKVHVHIVLAMSRKQMRDYCAAVFSHMQKAFFLVTQLNDERRLFQDWYHTLYQMKFESALFKIKLCLADESNSIL